MGRGIRYRLAQPDLPGYEEVEPLWREVFESGRLTAGPRVEALEQAIAELCGVRHVVAVANCTLGLQLAMGLWPPGEVVMPAFAFVATAQAAAWAGHRPVFVECHGETFTVCPEAVAAAVRAETRAICAVNVFGMPPELDRLTEVAAAAQVPLVIDSAQGLGARWRGRPVGGFGAVEVFSLSPAKVLTGVEGGLLTTDDADLAERLRAMRDYGRPRGSVAPGLGVNGRLSELHAALALVGRPRLEGHVAYRRRLWEVYREALAPVAGVQLQRETSGGWGNATFFVVVFASASMRERVERRLLEEGVETRRHFWPPLHRFPSAEVWGARVSGALTETERLSAGALALPLHVGLREEDCAEIAGLVRSAVSGG